MIGIIHFASPFFQLRSFDLFFHILWNLSLIVSSNLVLNMVMEFNSIGSTVSIFCIVDWDGNKHRQ